MEHQIKDEYSESKAPQTVLSVTEMTAGGFLPAS